MEFRRVLFRSTDQFRPISKYLADRLTIEENVAFELTRCHDRAFFRVSAGNKIDIDFRPRDANRRHVRAPPCGSGRSGFLSLYGSGDFESCTVKIGRGSCRARVWHTVKMWGGAE